jgi:phage terminase large subunit-like protein
MTPTAENFPRPLAQRAWRELARLPPEVQEKLKYEWDLWVLPHQVPPDWEWDTWLNEGGRGSGKTTGASQYLRDGVENRGVQRINLIGRTAASIRDDMVNGEAGIIQAFPPNKRPQYVSSQSLVRFHTGAVALMLTAEEPRLIQGKNAELTWLDEFSTYGDKTEEVWEQVCLATRVGNPKKIITTNSLPDNPFLQKLTSEAAQRRIALTKSTSFHNFANLPPAYQLQVQEMMRTAWGRAWVLGEYFKPEGALWKEAWFQYLDRAPAGGRTVVAVDPAGTEFGDETGIVVAKRIGLEKFGYVLEDLSGHHPSEGAEGWPAIVVDAARRHGASCIVIERNRGLDFLKALVRMHKWEGAIKEVNVDIKKDQRAIPIAALYEAKRIFHCPKMVRLEEQMTNWDPASQAAQRARRKATSPDRIDAAVHAIHELGFHLAGVDMSMTRVPRRDR